MLGNAVFRELLGREEVTGWSRSVPRTPDGIKFVRIDLNTRGVQKALTNANPELIINCAALTDADFCEANRYVARLVNTDVPETLASTARGMGARFVQISTDAVYDGEKLGRRREGEQPNPGSVYAATKLEGEGRVLAAYPDALVIRTTMFGWTLPTAPRPKFAEQILGALTARVPIKLWTDAIFSPLHVGDLAKAILRLAGTNASGVLNVGSRTPISKADFGREIATVFGLDGSLVEDSSVDESVLLATRTKNVGLDVSRCERILRGDVPSVLDGIDRLYQEAFDGRAETIRGRKTYP